ncbi:LacI family DNA-binding transcriptional regulator [Pseudolysinimonas sp.]|uniref:LacI family DNA-binding transcriptional regulator n=1 Tax=Pseudolysinimonas sp. TaxID=2680009 RepID=UPI003F8040D0
MDARATRPTLSAVARRAGVSVSTASLVFSGAGPVAEATRARVLEAAADLDYGGPDPTARSLRRGRSGVIGLVTEDKLVDAFRDPVNLALIDALGEELGDERLGLLVLPMAGVGGLDPGEAALDVAVLLGCSTTVSDPVASLRRRGVPMIGVETEPLDGVAAIDLDNRASSATAARLLADLGHERVAVVTLPLESAHVRGPLSPEREAAGSAHVVRERLAGVREVFPAAGGVSAGASSVDEGLRAGRALLDVAAGDRPTAILAQSDLLAAGVVLAADELGVGIPEELSVVGFDGIRLDGVLTRPLTTMAQPIAAKGRAAGRAVLAAIRGEHVESVELRCELRDGATTGPAPSATSGGRS